MRKLNITLIGLGLTPSTGGPLKTVTFFKDALSAKVIAFTSADKLLKEQCLLPKATYIKTDDNFVGKFYSFAKKTKRKEAEEIVSKSNLLSCHILWRYSSYWTFSMSKKYNIPYWVVPHGSVDPYVFDSHNSFIKKIWFFIFGKKFLKNAAHIICSTQKEKEQLMLVYKGDNITVVHWPVNMINGLHRKKEIRLSFRERYGIAPNIRILLFLGRMHPIKRPIETIKLFLKSDVSNTVLFLAGPFEQYTENELNAFIRKENSVADSVKILGPIYGAEKDDLLLASDCLISLSDRENFGHVAVESLSVGNPVILSPGNFLSRDLEDIDCGWMLKDMTDQNIINTIKEFSKTKDSDLNVMGNNGKDWVIKNLNIDIFEKRIMDLAKKTIESDNVNTK